MELAIAMFLGLLSGLLLRVAGPEWPLAPLAVLGIATWAAAVRGQRSHWNAMACTVIFVLLGIASRLNWLFPMDHGDSVPGVYRLGWIILSALFVTTLALLSISMRGLARRDWPMVVVVPLTWMVWEAAVGWVLGRMMNLLLDPIRLATTQVTFPFCQLADLGGLTLVAGSVAAASGLLLDVIDEQAGRASRTLLTRLGAVTLLCLLTYGAIRSNWHHAEGQLNVELRTEQFPPLEADKSGHFSLDQRVELLIWPEGSITGTLGIEEEIDLRLVEIAKACDRPILAGATRFDLESPGLFNSAILVRPDSDIVQSADKRFLAPVTECLPPLSIWFELPEPLLPTQRARSIRLLRLSDGTSIGSGVCFDLCFPDWARDVMEQKPDVLVQIASEQFSPSASVKHQMLALARLRAIESRRTLVRCVRHGYSAVIDANGDIVDQVKDWRSTEPLIVQVPIMRGASLYHKIGETIPWTLVVLGCALAEWESRWAKRKVKAHTTNSRPFEQGTLQVIS